MLENSRVLELVRLGAPEKSEPANKEAALLAVQSQRELNWADFLT